MKDISIIGATSQLGVHLVNRLSASGYRVNATYRSPDRIPETWNDNDLINCVRLDLNGQPDLGALCTDHVVWLAHLDQGRFNEREVETNLEPFERFLKCSADSSVRQITLISSGGSVYGEAQHLPITEDHPRDPLSSYGKAKKAMEDALIPFGKSTQVRIAIVRPGNIYGFESPAKGSKGIVGAFLNSSLTRTPFTLIHEGMTVRDFIHVDDICQAVVCAIESEKKEKIWNAGTGVASRISDVLDLIIQRSGLEKPEFVHQPNYSSDVQSNVLSIERIINESHWKPAISLEDGIDATVTNWMNSFSTNVAFRTTDC